MGNTKMKKEKLLRLVPEMNLSESVTPSYFSFRFYGEVVPSGESDGSSDT